jgi:peptide/nickel transport system permease protein
MTVRSRILHNPRVLVSGGIILILIVAAIFAPWIAPHDPFKINPRFDYALPSPDYILGNDQFGRDVLSRLIYGTRLSFAVAFSSVGLAFTVGVALGITASYYGGWIDTIIMRTLDVVMAYPTMLLAVAMIAFMGTKTVNVVWIIALISLPRFARIAYASGLSVKENQYVEASRAIGAPDWRILTSAILLNILAPLFVQTALALGSAILIESGLSFLGLGPPPPAPTWGSMVATGRQIMDVQPVMVVWPSLALAIVVLSFNILGNGLRDALDPRLRKA